MIPSTTLAYTRRLPTQPSRLSRPHCVSTRSVPVPLQRSARWIPRRGSGHLRAVWVPREARRGFNAGLTVPLTVFERHRTGAQEVTPCAAGWGSMRTERISSASPRIEIHNAESANVGPRRRFCTWSLGIGAVGGDSLVYPWTSLRHALDHTLTGDRTWHISRLRGGAFSIDATWLRAPLQLRRRGWLNTVALEREDGRILALFSPVRARIRIDLEIADPSEKVAILAVLGSGLHLRAQRGALWIHQVLPTRP